MFKLMQISLYSAGKAYCLESFDNKDDALTAMYEYMDCELLEGRRRHDYFIEEV